MTQFKFRPSLESMDERIVPDATAMEPPLTGPADPADPAPQIPGNTPPPAPPAGPAIPPPQIPANPQNTPNGFGALGGGLIVVDPKTPVEYKSVCENHQAGWRKRSIRWVMAA